MRLLTCFAALALLGAHPGRAQSLLYRPPNLGGTWTGAGGVVHFNFLHRFYVAPEAGGNKVTNFPTFTLGAGIADRVLVGLRYASNSLLTSGLTDYRPNEIELLARWRVLGADGTPGLALAVQPAYNTAARSFDGEFAADYTAGRFTVSGAARVLGKPFGIDSADAKFALSGGASVRLNRYVALGGDVAQVLDADTTLVWSAGISFLIPNSPHTFSLHASRATSTTIQGASVAGFARVLYGFEFTIPLHLSRFGAWFSGGRDEAATAGEAAATVRIAQLRFQTDTVTIAAGQTVRWINDDEVVHTVTFPSGPRGSGELGRGAGFSVTFERPGVYAYHCTPHPFMSGVVVVQ